MRLIFLISLFLWPSLSAADGQSYWKSYRDQSPFLDQSIVVIDRAETHTFIILTEPRAAVFEQRDTVFQLAFPDRLENVEVFEKRVGVDGAVRDLVLTFSLLNADERDEVVRTLTELLYGTDYKASYVPFNPGPWSEGLGMARKISVPNLDLGPQDIWNWLAESSVEFEPLGFSANSNPASFQKLMATELGVFRSTEPGLIVAILDRNRQLNEQEVALRQFLVDSDLILAAIVRDEIIPRRIALVGRERDMGLDAAPPLRLDTILTLAANKSEELAQSYERNLPFAGRITETFLTDGLEVLSGFFSELVRLDAWGADWAPILLSRELTHTEYGHLLNITDQMLKSWSLAGDIDYVNFPYPKPSLYPDPEGVWEALDEGGDNLDQLTFNWNTAGAAFWTEIGGHQIMTPTATGALPVSYIPAGSGEGNLREDDLRAAEDRYLEFFADRQDPMLLRVAQYAALHQLFTRYSMRAERTEPLVDKVAYEERWQGLTKLTSNALSALAAKSSKLPEEPASGCSLAVQAEFIGEELLEDFQSANPSPLAEFSDNERLDLAAGLVDLRALLRDKYGDLNAAESRFNKRADRFNDDVAKYNARAEACNRRLGSNCTSLARESAELDQRFERMTADQAALERKFVQHAEFVKQQTSFRAQPLLSDVIKLMGNCTEAIAAVQSALPPSGESVYKTPSIVVSVPRTNWNGVGGHNLDGRTVDVIVDQALRNGEIRVDPTGNAVRIAPNMAANRSRIAREFERRRVDFLDGSQAYRARVTSQLARIGKTEARPPLPFTQSSLKRSNATGSARGAHETVGGAHRFIDNVQRDISADRIADIKSFAEGSEAQIFLTRNGREVSILDATKPPPVAYVTNSPSAAWRFVEARSATVASEGNSTVQIQTRNMSQTEAVTNARVLAMKDAVDAQARTLIGGSSGGGGKPPASNVIFGFFEGGNGGRGSFNRFLTLKDSAKAKVSAIFFRKRKVDWSAAEVTSTTIEGNLVVNTITVPVQGYASNVSMAFKGIFGRSATHTDAQNLTAARDAALEAARAQPEMSAMELILRNREEFLRRYPKGSADFETQIGTSPIDAFSVTEVVVMPFGRGRG